MIVAPAADMIADPADKAAAPVVCMVAVPAADKAAAVEEAVAADKAAAVEKTVVGRIAADMIAADKVWVARCLMAYYNRSFLFSFSKCVHHSIIYNP